MIKVKFWAIILSLVAVIISCNPYKRLTTRPPLTPKDTAALLARCIEVSPLDTAVAPFIPQIPVLPDSGAFYRAISDSLARIGVIVRDSILVRYKDTCRSAVRIYNEAYRIGYDIGRSDGRSEAETMYNRSFRITDSLHWLNTSQLKRDYNLRLTAANNAKVLAQAEGEKYRKKNERLVKWTWGLSVAFLLAVIICILLWKFRRQAKAANSIINSGQDIADNLKKLK